MAYVRAVDKVLLVIVSCGTRILAGPPFLYSDCCQFRRQIRDRVRWSAVRWRFVEMESEHHFFSDQFSYLSFGVISAAQVRLPCINYAEFQRPSGSSPRHSDAAFRPVIWEGVSSVELQDSAG
jgi:hypothetical protein